jgi:hypothetical protein
MEPFNPYAIEEAEIAQKQKLAQALNSRRGMFWKMRAPKVNDQALELAKALQGRKQADWSSDASVIAQALQGRQAQPGIAAPADDLGGGPARPEMPAMTPQQMLAQALTSMKTPQGMQLALNSAKPGEAYTLKPGEIRYGPTGQVLAKGSQEKPANPEANVPFTLTPGAKRVGPDGKVIADNPRAESSTPYYSPVSTPQGLMAFDARTGRVVPIQANGVPVVKSSDSPTLQGQIAESKKAGQERGEATVQAQIDLPRVMDNANNALQIIDQMIGSEDGKTGAHPGFQTYVGATLTPGLRFIEGTDTANFEKLLDQSKGGAFLEAFNSLKGGGQITEVEGKKATDAITRMNKAQSEKEFVKAAREYQKVIRLGVQRAQQKAGVRAGGPDRRGVPPGVDPALWQIMTPEEKALWAR